MKHYNTSLNKNMNELFDLKGESVNDVSEEIIPIVDVNPKNGVNKIIRGTVAATIYTTPTDRDFYFYGSHLNAIATAPGSSTLTLTVTPKGAPAIIINDLYLINTVAIDSMSGISNLILPFPLLLERGSTIVLAVTGTSARTVIIFAYETKINN